MLLNIIWLVLAGFWLALGYCIAAVLMAITIIGLPRQAGAQARRERTLALRQRGRASYRPFAACRGRDRRRLLVERHSVAV